MITEKVKTRAEHALEYLPREIRDEIVGISLSRRGGLGALREIRLRAMGRSSVTLARERVPLFGRVGEKELTDVLYRLCGGSIYAHRDSINSGYVSIGEGIRVGVCGLARYEDGAAVGIGGMTSLVFRIPVGDCEFERELFTVWDSGDGGGMLIYSSPGVGKTTALRSLARHIGGGKPSRRVVVVDERCEFIESDYPSAEVDILKGYRRREGIEIATRTMSPDVIIIDEIGADDARELSDVLRCGVPVIASAHASSLDEIYSRGALCELLERGAFTALVGIHLKDGVYSLSVDRR